MIQVSYFKEGYYAGFWKCFFGDDRRAQAY